MSDKYTPEYEAFMLSEAKRVGEDAVLLGAGYLSSRERIDPRCIAVSPGSDGEWIKVNHVSQNAKKGICAGCDADVEDGTQFPVHQFKLERVSA